MMSIRLSPLASLSPMLVPWVLCAVFVQCTYLHDGVSVRTRQPDRDPNDPFARRAAPHASISPQANELAQPRRATSKTQEKQQAPQPVHATSTLRC